MNIWFGYSDANVKSPLFKKSIQKFLQKRGSQQTCGLDQSPVFKKRKKKERQLLNDYSDPK